jgi:hypothetical protein
MRILALSGLEHIADCFFDYAKGILSYVRPLTASACSGRHRTIIMKFIASFNIKEVNACLML